MEISLALSGGGVRGIAHLGVIRALEEYDFKVRAIAGTSAGGLVGAVYAAGIDLDTIEATFRSMDQNRSFGRHADDHPSLLGLSGVTARLSELLGDRTFDELKIAFAATAVSLHSGKELILNQGRVIDAVLATIAIPGVFPSQEIGGRVLVDGGVLDPVPVQVARWMRPDLPVVAVVLHRHDEVFCLEESPLPIPIPGPSSISDRLAKLRPVQAFKIFTRSIEVASQHLSELGLQLYQPEIIIAPQVGHVGVLQNVDTTELIQIGKDAAEETFGRLMEKSDWKSRIQRQKRKNARKNTAPTMWEILEV